ncbi:hypothetical protein BF93_12100 [Brachybacterium phenoliresistens]|uniref:IclR family transcriptional regulator n=1 Tax=Brachybacterium phenoliresistens TaxID=396014 RepID=Z9JX24_9MICO|nr:IclR family transcriptional regulator [Brachybacterium phenoliresistens]EWS82342.1 hypothetical protein BF93_12100 [Brachybacterium phenoliresistens]
MSQTVKRAITILERCSERPSTVQELADTLGTHRTTALRLVQTLEASGFLRSVGNARYGVGFRLAGLASRAVEQFDLRELVHPHLQELSDAVGFTVQLAVPQGDRLIYVDKIEPPSSITLNTRIGGEVVIHTAGVSKAILAHLDPAQRDRIIAHATFEKHTDSTITDPDRLRAVLELVAARGWSTDDGEFETFSNCIAAPVFDGRGACVGALSITAFTHHATIEQLQEHLPLLLETTRRISRELGAPEGAQETAAAAGSGTL